MPLVHLYLSGLLSRWRHQMEIFSALLAICKGNPRVSGGFPSQRPVTQSFDAFFDLRLKKRLSKQLRRRWFETSLRSLWRHYNVQLNFQGLTPLVISLKFNTYPYLMKHSFGYFTISNYQIGIFVRYTTTGMHLWCHVQNFVAITSLECRLNENELWMTWTRIFYPSGHWPETVRNAPVSAHFR